MRIQNNRQQAGRLRSMKAALRHVRKSVRELQERLDRGDKAGFRPEAQKLLYTANYITGLAGELHLYALMPQGVDLTAHARLLTDEEVGPPWPCPPVPPGGILLHVDRNFTLGRTESEVCKQVGGVVVFQKKRYTIEWGRSGSTSRPGTFDSYESVLGLAPCDGTEGSDEDERRRP